MTDVQKNLMSIISNIVEEKEFPTLSNDDLFCTLKLAYQYKILTVIYNYIFPFESDERFECFEKSFYNSSVLNANQEFFYNKISDYSQKNQLEILMLKGFQISKFYPQKSCREMCDIDFYYSRKDKSKVDYMMKALGFEHKERQDNHDTWCHKDTQVFAEAHFSLSDVSDEYLNKIIDRKASINGSAFACQMSNEDLFIFTIIHLHHHLVKGTFNFKQFLDFYVTKKRCRLDFDYINPTIQNMGLKNFVDNLDKVSLFLFEKKDDNGVCDFAEYLLGNKNFGNNAVARYAADFNGKSGFAFRRFFPKKEKIFSKYPFTKKYKFLLPIGYLLRLFNIIFKQNSEIPYQLKIMKNINKDVVAMGQMQNEFLKKYGIIFK